MVARTASLSVPWPQIMMTVGWLSASMPGSLRICSSTSCPEIPVSCTSSSTMSGSMSGSRASASSPLEASSTRQPSPSSTMRTVRRMFFSSSTMSTVVGMAVPPGYYNPQAARGSRQTVSPM